MTLSLPRLQSQAWPGLIRHYWDYLPVSDSTPTITLNEGNTPLVSAPAIAEAIGKSCQVFVKLDGLNPTGSFKDRGMTVAVSKAKEKGAEALICASTGNTSASAAAYAAKGKMRAYVLLPDGYVAKGKMAQALMHGAEAIAIRGNFDEALAIVCEIAAKYPVALVNSVNPYRLCGQKTAAFEIVDALGDAPDWLCIPVGNAGNISAYWMGFSHYRNTGKSSRSPQMFGFEAEGSAAIALNRAIANPSTVATAIRIGNPASWHKATAARDLSGGDIGSVTDAEILAAYRLLAREEGIFCEPASAASVAGLLKYRDRVPTGATIVCVLTGNGLKDPDTAVKHCETDIHSGIPANLSAVAKVMGF
ncbi:threonine synthase [Synechococcus sp. PCC 7336]|uniref:threonine synthase n=1 Tax=Synechococcus sp. PCC 7336 TaxID=195250 RepID=UPI000344AED3|nr:threonine synthase [Synechococcus sp. PCC 7336]